MGVGAFLFAISLLYVTEAQGLQQVFVLHGKDLHLDIKKPVELDQETFLFWKFNNNNNICRITHERTSIFNIYKGRAEFGEKFTLLLKNVQHSDSGVYAAVTAGERDQTVAEYNVTVQDPVSPVELTVTNSSDPCNITVTCSTVDLNISRTFRCDAHNCSQMEEKSLKATKNFSSLIIYLQQDNIFCNHSNQVSWKQSKVTKLQCEPKPVTNGAIIVGAPIGVVIIVFLTVVIVLFSVRKCKRGNTENTVYEVPQDILPDQNQRQPVSGDASCHSPTSTYALVEFHTGPETTKTKNTPQPETVYAQVNRAAKHQPTGPTTNTQS